MVIDTTVVAATPCVPVSKHDQENKSCATAVLFAEFCALIQDDGENKIPIGRRYKNSKIMAPRNLLMPDEFTERKTKIG